ncbi:hypothetical protein IFM89_013485 [Coptis chinensis]|uniref:DUF3741 domain-containing protein n=1 Tax=Coptis chinensis TaxID=261450 RepID=A0A835I9F7_9MAGN|nr:hypothetical protein IFM89_013485 [Coptis chinensis]
MTKKSQRRLVQHERGQSGCMSGLISIFDFRQGRSTHKLLSDRRHGSSRHPVGTAPSKSRLKLLNKTDEKHQGSDADVENYSDDDETKILKLEKSNTSVKKLIEEDMSGEQQTEKHIPSAAKELIQPGPDVKGSAGKFHKPTKKNCKVACDIHVQDSRDSATLESHEYYQTNSAKRVSRLDITSLMEEFCSQIQHHQEVHLHRERAEDSCGAQECTDFVKCKELGELDMHLVQKLSVQEKFSEAAEAFLNQKLIDTKQLNEDGPIQSKHFVDALEILNSNKELLLKLVKNIEDPHDAPSDGYSRQAEVVCSKEVQKQNIHKFFWKKDKFQRRNTSKESDNSQVSNRIVVLKPKAKGAQISATANCPSSSPQSPYSLKNTGWSGRFNSQFSLSEIKRKLKSTMGENRNYRHRISMDGILHKVPKEHCDSGNSVKGDPENIGGRELPSKSNLHIERTSEPSTTGETSEPSSQCNPSTAHEVASTSAASRKNLTMNTGGYSKQREANIYLEAKKHLEEILTGGDQDEGFSSQQVPKTLARILSLPEYNSSPGGTPGRDSEHDFVTAQMRFSSNGNFQTVSENIWQFKPSNNAIHPTSLRTNLEIQHESADGDDSGINLQQFDSKPDKSEELLAHTEIHESICPSKVDSSLQGAVDTTGETDVDPLEEDNLLDGPCEANSSTFIISTVVREEEESSKCLRLEPPTDDEPPSSSSCSLPSGSLVIQKVESLQSINDLPERPSPVSVLEPFFDDNSSPTTTTPKSAELPIQPQHFQFEDYDCSTVVVTSSSYQENYSRSCAEDEMTTFEYVEAVLKASNVNWGELSEKYHSSEMLLNPYLFDEVEVISSQYCDDRKIIGKDMEKSKTWMDVRYDVEFIGHEMVEDILEELMGDIIFDFCS